MCRCQGECSKLGARQRGRHGLNFAHPSSSKPSVATASIQQHKMMTLSLGHARYSRQRACMLRSRTGHAQLLFIGQICQQEVLTYACACLLSRLSLPHRVVVCGQVSRVEPDNCAHESEQRKPRGDETMVSSCCMIVRILNLSSCCMMTSTLACLCTHMHPVPFMALHHTRPTPAKATPCDVMHESWNRPALRVVEMAMRRRMRPGPARQAQPQRAAHTTPSSRTIMKSTPFPLLTCNPLHLAPHRTAHNRVTGSTRTTGSSLRSTRGR
jgi:hypothetical protein